MANTKLSPDFIFESSWEVCNKVGGIYTVLSTRAKTLQDAMPDKLVFIGPDFWQEKENPLFIEDKKMWKPWTTKARKEGLDVRVGRWNIPLSDNFFKKKFNMISVTSKSAITPSLRGRIARTLPGVLPNISFAA